MAVLAGIALKVGIDDHRLGFLKRANHLSDEGAPDHLRVICSRVRWRILNGGGGGWGVRGQLPDDRRMNTLESRGKGDQHRRWLRPIYRWQKKRLLDQARKGQGACCSSSMAAMIFGVANPGDLTEYEH